MTIRDHLAFRLPLRAAQVIAVVILAFIAGRQSYTANVERAQPFGHNSPNALNFAAKKLLLDGRGTRKTGSLAKTSLRLQSLNPSASALLAMEAQASRQHAKSKNLFDLSKRASRRELLTHLAAIEDRSANDDAKGAMAVYDLALRTSTEASSVLFPILARAIEDERIRAELEPYVKQKVIWTLSFAQYILDKTKAAPFLGQVVLSAGGFGRSDRQKMFAYALVSALVDAGDTDQARGHFLLVAPEHKQVLESIAFSKENFDPRSGRFGWALFENAAYGATRSGNDSLNIYAGGSARGVVAQKLSFFQPGTYSFGLPQLGRMGSEQAPAASWHIYCVLAAESKILFVSSANGGAEMPKPWGPHEVTIPSGCSAQLFQLSVVGPDTQVPSEAKLSSATFHLNSVAGTNR